MTKADNQNIAQGDRNSFSPSLQGPRQAVKPEGGPFVYLVTGGTGFLGTAIVKHLLSLGHKVRAYARNEHSHEALIRSIPQEHLPRFTTLIGAVEDPSRLRRAMKGVTHVISAAAQKIVPLAEGDPWSCIQTNTIGTRNVADACLDAGVSRAVLVSTDKASAPATLYGASKLCAERLWLGGNRYSAGHGTEFVAVRYGNVFASRGSVLEAWASHHKAGKRLQITDARSTRFHITRREAVELVTYTLEAAEAGELWIPRLPTYRLGDLCHAFRVAHGIKDQPEVIGLRLAEKLHEDLISESESMACKGDKWTSGGDPRIDHYILQPGKVNQAGGWGYTSGTPGHQLGVDELVRLIELWKGGVHA